MFSSVGKRKYLGYFIYNFEKTPLCKEITCRMETIWRLKGQNSIKYYSNKKVGKYESLIKLF